MQCYFLEKEKYLFVCWCVCVCVRVRVFVVYMRVILAPSERVRVCVGYHTFSFVRCMTHTQNPLIE